MQIAYVSAPGAGAVDRLVLGMARRLTAAGLRTCGIVQINTERSGGAVCDMDVHVLPDGPVLRISQRLGSGARGCRLEPAALEEAAGLVLAGLARGADVLIVNKFGKHEADGRGFRPVIAEALALDIPVLVGVSASNRDAFLAFAGDMAVALPPGDDALPGWLTGCRGGMGAPTA
ncbi:Nucleoside-triphosphatase THEP1 [Roseovarius azorensis]|uniref:Nucleoside-triphosphatase THEP1 n=1 Tax=Roseovarius azorensis TaxID=1287727 RepID=A0A1H7NLF1_9RHOB|nr:DUF2478 domain-containing protein [Roseovarius azorensis]SEL23818.1 Nucleoside-triphosphatase THEP1 [Roseovarius azorensis]